MTAMEPTTGGGILPSQWTGLPEYIGREVALMTAYEILSIFIEILALLMSFGSLVIALLAFLDKRNKLTRETPPFGVGLLRGICYSRCLSLCLIYHNKRMISTSFIRKSNGYCCIKKQMVSCTIFLQPFWLKISWKGVICHEKTVYEKKPHFFIQFCFGIYINISLCYKIHPIILSATEHIPQRILCCCSFFTIATL